MLNMKSDEYDWTKYHKHYNSLKARLAKTHTQVLTPENHKLVEGEIIMKEGELPMHPEHKLLYETILGINPPEVHEVGCGWGDHLFNIMWLNGDITVWGTDISQKQIDSAVERHPFLGECTRKHDITKGPAYHTELVFTQAVLVHLSDSNLRKAILNIAASAQNHILFMENLKRRDYPQIFRDINPSGWEKADIERVDRYGAGIIIVSR